MERRNKFRFLWEFLLLWGIWMLMFIALTDIHGNPNRLASRVIVSLLGFFIIITVNMRYLFPHLYLQKKQFLYFISCVALITATALVLHLEIFPWTSWLKSPLGHSSERIARNSSPGIKWFREILHLLIALLGSTVIGISRFANKKEKEAFHLKNENLETELKFLKSQVNPHFLFNALNNIYSLAVMQAPQTPESIMQLSEILRYMVYDSNENNVSLKSEINYIENFVELQLLKDSRGMNVELDLDKSASEIQISPLLLAPFVENAFKHSKIESLKDGFIKISLKVIEKEINFHCINSKPKDKFTKDGVGGVGLENTKKRLNILYPDHQHDLIINDTEEEFEVILKLKLRE